MVKFSINEKLDNYSPNYLATICRIGELRPIANADKLKMTTVNGHDIIVSSDYKEGDVVVYFPCETAISEKYLSANNLYEIGECDRNKNHEHVTFLKEKAREANAKGDKEAAEQFMAMAKKDCGFFNKYGRVRILKLRGEYSDGFVAGVESLVNAFPELKDFNWDDVMDTQFNSIDDEVLCWKFVPPIRENNHVGKGQGQYRKLQKKLVRFDRLISEHFHFHFDTIQLKEHMSDLSPDDIVSVSVKIHGTSTIDAMILCNRKLSWWEKVKKFFGAHVETTEYDLIYSSRKVIKNRYINKDAHDFYDVDIWGCVARDFGPYIPKGMTVYGEIVGYLEGSNKMIQDQHDYGCLPGSWKFMPYRITTEIPDDTTTEVRRKEWNVTDVDAWTRELVKTHPELEPKVLNLNIVYHGRLGDMYPDIDESNHWHENFLARLKSDKEWLLMEQDEPMCRNKVPREGYVFRIDDDKFPRAWKIKSMRHFEFEGKQHDKGKVDIEEAGGVELE